MRHRRQRAKLDRNQAQRQRLVRGLVQSLILHGRIKTTPARARVVRALAEKLITIGRSDSIASRRRILATIPQELAVKKLISDISPRFKNKNGGYTRLVKTAPRAGDSAAQVIIEILPNV